MKKLIGLLLVVLATAGCPKVSAPNPPVINPDWAITYNFTYDFTNFVSCSTTVTKGCISNFSFGYMQGSVQVPLKSSAPAICTGATQPLNCTDTVNSTLGIGPTTFYCFVNVVQNDGTPAKSNVMLSPVVQVNADDPKNFNVTLK